MRGTFDAQSAYGDFLMGEDALRTSPSKLREARNGNIALSPPTVGNSDSVMTLLNLIDNCPAVAVFLDLEKAFELASADAILTALVRKGIRGRLLAWTEDYLRRRRARVRFQGHYSASRELENGTPQGGILSPSLINLLMEQLVSLPLTRARHCSVTLTTLSWLSQVGTTRSPRPSRHLTLSATSVGSWALRYQQRNPRP